MKHFNLLVALIVATMLGACVQHDEFVDGGEYTIINVGLDNPTKTSLGEKGEDGVYPIYWVDSDCLVVNGVASSGVTLNDENPARAGFKFAGIVERPYNITFPYTEGSSCSAETPTVVFPAAQRYVEGSFDLNAAPMYGHSAAVEESTSLTHLAGVLRLPFKGNIADRKIKSVTITTTTEGAALAGEYAVDCQTGALTVVEGTTSQTITYSLGEAGVELSTSTGTPFYITLPAGSYGVCYIVVTDIYDNTMTLKWTGNNVKAGIIREFGVIPFKSGIAISLDDFDSEQGGTYSDQEATLGDLEILNDEALVDYIPGTVFGYVKDNAGNPISGVAVSNGFAVAVTNEEGYYSMGSNADSYHIYYTAPAEYEIPLNEQSTPCFYTEYSHFHSRYNFTLTPLAGGKENAFTLFGLADPQVESAGELTRFETEAVPKIKAHAETFSTPRYGVALGDIIQMSSDSDLEGFMNAMYANMGYDDIGLKMFYVMGNHDHNYFNKKQPLTTDWRNSSTNLKAQRYFERVFGPANFSVNRGDAHIISMRNTIFNSNTDRTEYTLGFTDAQLAWLQADLANVPNDKLVILCVHIPLYNNDHQNVQAVLSLLNQYPNAHILSGHTHISRSYEHKYQGTTHTNIYEHNVAAVCGCWWRSNLNGDGAPNGYKVFEIEGNQITNWYYMGYPTGMDDRDYQMRLYRGDAITGGPRAADAGDFKASSTKGYYQFNFGSNVILANIFGADDEWTVEVYEDGSKTGEMTWMTRENEEYVTGAYWTDFIGNGVLADDETTTDVVETPFNLGTLVSSRDLWACGYHMGIMGTSAYASSGFPKCWTMWRYTLVNPDAETIEVKATDRFGRTYSCSTITEGTDYTLAVKP